MQYKVTGAPDDPVGRERIEHLVGEDDAPDRPIGWVAVEEGAGPTRLAESVPERLEPVAQPLDPDAETVEQIRWARAHGLNVFAETCPQYLFLTAEDLGP